MRIEVPSHRRGMALPCALIALTAAPAALGCPTTIAAAQTVSFQGLGPTPGEDTFANGMSADGQVVVRHYNAGSTLTAFRWTNGANGNSAKTIGSAISDWQIQPE